MPRCSPSRPSGGGNGARRAQHRIVHHQGRDRGAGDRVDAVPSAAVSDPAGLADIPAAVLLEEAREVAVLDADDQDRLVVLDDHRAGDEAVQVEADQEVERLGRVAGGLDDLVGREDVAHEGRPGRRARPAASPFARPETVASGKASRKRDLPGPQSAFERPSRAAKR